MPTASPGPIYNDRQQGACTRTNGRQHDHDHSSSRVAFLCDDSRSNEASSPWPTWVTAAAACNASTIMVRYHDGNLHCCTYCRICAYACYRSPDLVAAAEAVVLTIAASKATHTRTTRPVEAISTGTKSAKAESDPLSRLELWVFGAIADSRQASKTRTIIEIQQSRAKNQATVGFVERGIRPSWYEGGGGCLHDFIFDCVYHV